MQIEVDVSKVCDENITRIQELIQRTNRLNMSNRHHMPEDVNSMISDTKRSRCRIVSARDCFGEYGLIGFYVIDVQDTHAWCIKDFMLSCHVHGRDIDVFVLSRIITDAISGGAESVRAYLIPNGRNDDLSNALSTAGFLEKPCKSEGRCFEFDSRQQKLRIPEHINSMLP